MPKGNPQIPLRFGAQIVPALGRGGICRVVCGLVDGRPVALTCDADSSVRVWDMGNHEQRGRPVTPRGRRSVSGVAYGALEGRPVAVLVGSDIWVWDLTGRQVGHVEVSRHPPGSRAVGTLRDVACTRLRGRLVAVTGGDDCKVWIWDLATAKQFGDPLCGHTGVIRSVVCGVRYGRPIAVTGSEDQTVRVWDLAQRKPIGRPLRGHTGQVWAVACGMLDGKPVAVSGSTDRTLRLWELTDPGTSGTQLLGHNKGVHAVALSTVAERTVAVSGGEDVRVWDLRNRRQAGSALLDDRDVGPIASLACGTLHGRPVALAASGYGWVRVWDLEEHRRNGTDVPARHIAELPASWTDPAAGARTRDLVDPNPLDQEVKSGIAAAHDEDDFDDMIAPRPKRRKTPRRRRTRRTTHSPLRQYFEFQVVDQDRILSAERLAALGDQFPEATLSPTRMVWDFDPDDRKTENPGPLIGESRRDKLLRYSFDAHLEFQAGGLRCLTFRLPITQLDRKAVRAYVTNGIDGLSARVRGSSLLLDFCHYEEDGEHAHREERPGTWLKPLLPLWADLAGGDLSAAYVGWLKAVQEADDRADLQPPPRPATFQEMTPQLKKLATLLHLNRWARKHLS